MFSILNKIVGFHGGAYFGKDVYNVGGGQTGGSVVATTPAGVASAASQYGVSAANEASSLAAQSIGAAISATNAQYQTATAALNPATQEGVQALDKLNSYIGLSAYDPGTAPVAPTAPTAASLASSITQQDMLNYINQNTSYSSGGAMGMANYTGWGADTLNNGGTVSRYLDDGGGLAGQDNALLTQLNSGSGQTLQNYLAQQEVDDPNSYANLSYGIENTAYQQQNTQYQYAKNLQTQYNAAGPMTANDITNTITNQPGYQAQLQQGIGAINSDAAAKGYLGSGQMLKELNQFGQNTLSQFYGNTLSQLASLAGAGQQAATSQASLATSQGNSLASLLSSLGQDQANAALSAGNSQAQATLLGGQQYQVMGQSSTSGAAGIGSILGGLGSLASSFL